MIDHLSPDSQLRLPDVDEVLDIGHAIHAADDPSLKDTINQEIARQVVRDFLAIEASAGTPEVPYLHAVRSVARSYGRAITRRKQAYLRELENAKEEYDERRSRLFGSRVASQGLGVLWRFVLPIILGLSGFVVAKVIGQVVPTTISDKTGTNIPSVILSLTFVFAGRLVGQFLSDRKRDQIKKAYEVRCSMATEEYEQGKLREFSLWRNRLIEEWETYTGLSYPTRGSYQMIMEGDLEARRRFEESLNLHARTDVERVVSVVKGVAIKIRRKKADAA